MHILRAAKLLVANFPAMKEIAMEFVDTVFVPKVIAKQLALAVALQTGMVRSWPKLLTLLPTCPLSTSHDALLSP